MQSSKLCVSIGASQYAESKLINKQHYQQSYCFAEIFVAISAK